MKFDRWMKNTGLSESSVSKYLSAIEGAMSKWALEAKIISGNLLDIKNREKFEQINKKIQQLTIFQERNTTGHYMYSNALKKYSDYLSKSVISSIEDDIENILMDSNMENTEKIILVNSRIGQGMFRNDLVQYWGKCAVTGYENVSLLVASHIKPWSKASSSERLDKYNGLLLSPNLDKAFDQGYISFSDSGDILISPSFNDCQKLFINSNMTIPLATEHKSYMEYHRKNIFIRT